jgi:hypothetical protein
MKRIDNLTELEQNKILVIDDFLSLDECNNMLFLLQPHKWNPSMVIQLGENNTIKHFVSTTRTSKTFSAYDFNNELKQLISRIELKVCKRFDINRAKIEGWQISKYGYKEKFEPHLDCLWKDNIYGLRQKTILLYLLTPSLGGETFFRALNLLIKPIRGRLVIWDNLLDNGNCNHAMIHGSLPVKQGIKIILNTWVHN